MALENLVPYFRGARYALVAMRLRHPEWPGLEEDVQRYHQMLDRYSEAAVATYRLRRAKEAGDGSR